MKYKYIYILPLVGILSCLAFFTVTYAKDFTFFSISNPGGNFASQTSTVISPTENKKIFWSFHKSNLANGRVTSEATRIHIPRSRTLYVMTTDKDAPIEKFEYTIESQRENNFFRVYTINNNPAENFVPTVTLQNDSAFPFTLKDWKLTGETEEEFVIALPDEEMDSGETRTFIVPLLQQGGTLKLISPLERVKDRVVYPLIPKGKVLQRQEPANTKDVRPEFEIQ